MKPSILIVEDERDILDILTEILELEGYAVVSASNGREALERLSQIPAPNVILLDLLMPIMNGVEFRTAQLNEPTFADIPVLVMTADNSPATKFNEPDLKFLKKPLDIDHLIQTIAGHVRRTG